MQTFLHRRRHTLLAVGSCIAAFGLSLLLANIARADISGFGNFSGWQINQVDAQAAPVLSLSPGTIHLTGNAGNESRSVFNKTPQATSQPFTAKFTVQETGSDTTGAGFALVFQNDARGATAVGGAGSGLGYGSFGAIGSSVAVEFPLDSSVNAGVFTNGGVGSGTDSMSPVNFLSGDPINVTITYDGSVLRDFATDTVTNQTSATGLHILSLPATAFVGLTAGTTFFGGKDQLFSNFQFVSAVPEPSSLILIAIGGIALAVCARCRKHC